MMIQSSENYSFQSTAAMSGTIGLGNIAGVAVAISMVDLEQCYG